MHYREFILAAGGSTPVSPAVAVRAQRGAAAAAAGAGIVRQPAAGAAQSAAARPDLFPTQPRGEVRGEPGGATVTRAAAPARAGAAGWTPLSVPDVQLPMTRKRANDKYY